VLAPYKPGLFALGEEVIAPGEFAVGDGKRMLALFQISEAEDLGMALGRLFLSGSPERARFANGRCFARYVVIEDASQRRTALEAFQRWMVSNQTHVGPDAPVRAVEQSSAGSALADGKQSAGGRDFSRAATPTNPADAAAQPESSNKQAQIGPASPIPSGF
jgi:hypothetical protein